MSAERPASCVYGEAHPADVIFVWIEANGENRQEHTTAVCEGHAHHVLARATVPPGDNHAGASRPGTVILRMERA